jgi:hypothetical protein
MVDWISQQLVEYYLSNSTSLSPISYVSDWSPFLFEKGSVTDLCWQGIFVLVLLPQNCSKSLFCIFWFQYNSTFWVFFIFDFQIPAILSSHISFRLDRKSHYIFSALLFSCFLSLFTSLSLICQREITNLAFSILHDPISVILVSIFELSPCGNLTHPSIHNLWICTQFSLIQ